MALLLISLIWGIVTEWLVLLEAAGKQRSQSRFALHARSSFSLEALGFFQPLGLCLLSLEILGPMCLYLELGKKEVPREKSSEIGGLPFFKTSLSFSLDITEGQARLQFLAVK